MLLLAMGQHVRLIAEGFVAKRACVEILQCVHRGFMIHQISRPFEGLFAEPTRISEEIKEH